MKIPLQWLKEYIKIDIKPEQLADRLTMSGLEVSAIEYHGQNLTDVVVGKIKSMERHATRSDVSICQVDTGIKILQIVTKAGNIKVGDKVPVALHGATLPSGIKIQKRELHGVESFGMLCSEVELGISRSSDGIYILDKDNAVGEEIRKVLGTGGAVFEIDVLPNRIDVLSMIGVAREIGAVLNKKIRLPLIKIKEISASAEKAVSVTVKDKDLCPRYMARVIKGIKVKESPEWMQERLLACGMRPINNIVDITNYVLLEMGQPLHAFDLGMLKDGSVVVRRARKGEKLKTLDGVTREAGEHLVIADSEKPVAIAGVMGGANTEVSGATRDILLESAYFDPKTVHKTEKALKLRTEASIRFDRGVDWDAVEVALDRAAQLITENAGGSILKGAIDRKTKYRMARSITLRLSRVNQILGTKLKLSELRSILGRLSFKLKGTKAIIPLFRAGDIEREIDVIEEIARIYGYDKLPSRLPNIKAANLESIADKQLAALRQMLIDAGLTEVITYSMISEKDVKVDPIPGDSVQIMNPISDDLSIMRKSILPSLLKVLSHNINRQLENVNIFEAGKAFAKDPKGAFTEKKFLSGLLFGKRYYRYDGKSEGPDFFQLKMLIEDMMKYLVANHEVKAVDVQGFHPNRSAGVFRGSKLVAVFGQLHPDVYKAMDIQKPVFAFNVSLDDLLNIKRSTPKYSEIPQMPSSKRDIAMIVPVGVTNKAILDVISSAGGALVEDITLFDKYEGGQIEKGYYGLAYSITYRSPARTLTDDEVNAKHKEITDSLAVKLGVKIRQ